MAFGLILLAAALAGDVSIEPTKLVGQDLSQVTALTIAPECQQEPLPLIAFPPPGVSLPKLVSFSAGASIDDREGPQDCNPRVRITPAISGLTALEILSLDDVHDPLPASIGKLASLTRLRLSRCSLKKVPTFVRNLRKLTSINFWGNGITEVPGWMAELPALEVLDLRYNDVHRLPAGFPKLRDVYLGNNSLKRADIQQLRKSFPSVHFHFEDDMDDGAVNESEKYFI